jgi:vacuolar-type H+-ATPase subunit H
MMALFNKKSAPPLQSAPDSIKLQTTLDGIEAMLPTLAADYEASAFQQESDPSEFGAASLEDARKKLHEAEDRKRSLEAAILVAKQREADEHARAAVSIKKSQVASLKARLRNRDDVTTELVSALSDVAAAWDKLAENRANLETLTRELGVDPKDQGGGFLVDATELRGGPGFRDRMAVWLR